MLDHVAHPASVPVECRGLNRISPAQPARANPVAVRVSAWGRARRSPYGSGDSLDTRDGTAAGRGNATDQRAVEYRKRREDARSSALATRQATSSGLHREGGRVRPGTWTFVLLRVYGGGQRSAIGRHEELPQGTVARMQLRWCRAPTTRGYFNPYRCLANRDDLTP